MPACSLSSILVLPMTIIPLWPIERWTKGGRAAHLITFACALVFLESVVVKRRDRHMTFARNLAARGLMRGMAIISSSHILWNEAYRDMLNVTADGPSRHLRM